MGFGVDSEAFFSKEMKRILLILSSAKHETIATLSWNLYAELKKRGANIFAVVLNSTDEDFFKFDASLRMRDTTRCPLKTKIFEYKEKIKRIREFKKKNAVDLTICTDISCMFFGLSSKANDRVVGIFHRQLWRPKQEPVFSKKFLFRFFTWAFLFPRLDRFIAVSGTVEASLKRAYLGLFNKKIRLAYNVIDLKKVSSKANETLSESDEKFFNKDVVINVGRIDKNKNPMRLLRAFALLPSKIREKTNLLFVGPDFYGDFAELNSFIKKHALEKNVFYLGKRDNPYSLIARSKILVSSSLSEGLPTVLIEALHLGVPVAATDSTQGVWEILNCRSAYRKHLSENFEAAKGFITPNKFAQSETEKNQKFDDRKLSEALERLLVDQEFYRKKRAAEFSFEQLLNPQRSIELLTFES